MSLRVLSIGTLPPGSTHGASVRREREREREREGERETGSISKAFIDMSYVDLEFPAKEPSFHVPSQSSHREKRSVYTALMYCLPKSPGKELPIQLP